MATTIWQPVTGDGTALTDPVEIERDTPHAGLTGLATVRKLVSEILAEPGSHHPTHLTDEEWDGLCRSVAPESTDEEAVSRLLVAAFAVRDGRTTMPPLLTDSWDPALLETRQDEPAPAPVEPQLVGESPVDELIPVDFASATHVAPATIELPSPFDGQANEVAVLAQLRMSVIGHDLPELASDEGNERLLRQDGLRALPQRSHSRGAHSKSRVRVVEEHRRQRLLTVTSWVRNIGAIILLFVAWQLWGTAIQQHHTQAALQSQFESKVHGAPLKPAPGPSLIPATTAIPDPPQGTVMAELQIPKIGLQQFVVSGTDESDLNKGPGHYLGTAMPGQAGNVAVAGHRTTHGAPFNRLAELAIGDPIYLTAANGERLTYIVSAVPVAVSPRDVTVLNNFGDNRLTLTTCNPEYSAVQRLIVVAAFLPPGAAQPPKLAVGSGKAYSLTPSVTSGWNTSLLPWLTLELAALVVLGLLFGRLSVVYGRSGRWLVLVPVWLALLLATFETLTNFLPAAV